MPKKFKPPKTLPKLRNPVARSLADRRFAPRIMPAPKSPALRRQEDAARDAALDALEDDVPYGS